MMMSQAIMKMSSKLSKTLMRFCVAIKGRLLQYVALDEKGICA